MSYHGRASKQISECSNDHAVYMSVQSESAKQLLRSGIFELSGTARVICTLTMTAAFDVAGNLSMGKNRYDNPESQMSHVEQGQKLIQDESAPEQAPEHLMKNVEAILAVDSRDARRTHSL